jgi:flagellar motility protein MotE (MotC chaperone)
MKRMSPSRLATLALAAMLAGCATTKGPEPAPPGAEPPASADATAKADAEEIPRSGTSPLIEQGQPEAGADASRPRQGEAFEPPGVLRPVPGEGGDAREPMPPPPAPVSIGSASGAILALMPPDCRTRAYINVSALLGSDAAVVSLALDELLKAADPSGNATSAIRGLRDAGLDPVLAVREIAFCDRPEIAVVRVQPAQPADLLASIQRTLRLLGEKPGPLAPWGSMRTLSSPRSNELVVEVAPNVLMLANRPRDAAAALAAKAGATGFAGAAQQLAWVRDHEADLAVSEKAGAFDIQVSVHESGDGKRDQAMQAKLVAEIQKDLRKAADKLAKTPLGPLGAKLRTAKVTTSGNDVVIQGSISRAELSKLLKTLSSLKPDALAPLLRGF